MAKGGAGKGHRRQHRKERASNSAATASLSSAGRANRRNQAKQQRIHARLQQQQAHRASSGGVGAPKVVALIAAHARSDTARVARQLLAQGTASARATTSLDAASAGSATAVLPRGHRLTVLRPARSVGAVLDAGKSADVLILVIPVDGGLDALGEQLVDAMGTQGVGTVLGVLQGVEELPEKRKSAARREWASSLETRFPNSNANKFFSADLDPDGLNLMRHLTAVTPKPITWRAHASYVLTHAYTYTPDVEGSTAPLVHAASGTPAEPGGLAVLYGYVRGLPLSIDRAVHVPGVGDVLPEAIVRLPDPHAARGGGGGMGDDASMAIDGPAAIAPGGEPLVSAGRRMNLNYEAEGDGALAGEQTWPTAEELAAAEAANDDEDEDEDEEGEGEGDDGASAGGSDDEAMAMDDGGGGGGGASSSRSVRFATEDGGALEDEMDAAGQHGEGEDEAEARRQFLARRAARDDDAKFPDEVDTPLETPARERFARYRGLKSWRSSPWHPKENLPAEYGRIFHFDHWPSFQKHALREQADAARDHPASVASHGTYVAISVRVPAAFGERYGAQGSLDAGSSSGAAGGAPPLSAPLVVCGVNAFESHLSVIHFSLSLSAAAEAKDVTLKSKQPLLFQCGFRTFTASPLYSEDTRRADKHKLTRYVQPRQQVIASMYAPAMFMPAPLLAFLPSGDGAHRLLAAVEPGGHAASAEAEPVPAAAGGALGALGVPVATGSLLAVDADRIIIKKILLTGTPFRCHKRKAVVRWMFFTPEDVRWFRPVELHTKMGRKGAIRESLGTHGYMKCIFDGPMHQHDTVCMSLYKRAYPKWGTFTYRV